MELKNKKVAILGFGMEGQDLLTFLISRGALVTILDKKSEGELAIPKSKKNFHLVTGEAYLEKLQDFEIIFRSPGVYRYLPELVEAEKSGVKVSSAVKLFFDLCPARIIGVTGTKGKGTTASLIYQILKKDGKDVYLAGNIGKSYLGLLGKLNGDSIVVLELSSFQLIDLTKSPHIAAVLSITVDHLDWHKDKEEYIKAKENIVKYQKETDLAVIHEDNETSKTFAKITKARKILFSKNTLEIKYKEGLLLKGEHNLENVAAAVTVAKALGITEEVITSTLRSFKGLEHRLELVGSVKGVTFYNDSFATGPQPTIAAIKSFVEPLTIILGGSEKGFDYLELGEVVAGRENVKTVILIGALGGKMKKALTSGGFSGNIVDLGSKPMLEIVKTALEVTPKGGVILLSPAAASFDMFENYKDRGNQFKKAVQSL